MDDVTLSVNHYVAIMAVFNLKNVACDGVCSHRLNEIQASSLIRDCVLSSIFGNEKTLEIVDLRSAHFVARGGIRHNVDNTALQLYQTLRMETRRRVERTPGAVAVTR